MADIVEPEETIKDSLAIKHRKERKDLQAKIQSLKKSASKGDKKKRKEILEEIAKLEIDLEKRQAQEINDFNNVKTIEQHGDNELSGKEEIPKELHQRVSKAQRRRDKKAREEKEKEAEILAQEELNKNGPRMAELQTIKTILKERNLELHTIASDGDCLYNAIRHQLEITGRTVCEISYLRSETANYILSNKDNLIFYMTSSETGDILSDDEFEKYCEAIKNSPAWGGQIEIKALSNILKLPIEILQASGPPTILGGEEYNGPCLTITYHRHMYSLGEHYNSTKPISTENSSGVEDNGE